MSRMLVNLACVLWLCNAVASANARNEELKNPNAPDLVIPTDVSKSKRNPIDNVVPPFPESRAHPEASQLSPLSPGLSQTQTGTDSINLINNPACKEDILQHCSRLQDKSSIGIIWCMQNIDKKEDSAISQECHNVLWTYRNAITKDPSVALREGYKCQQELSQHPECFQKEKGDEVLMCVNEYFTTYGPRCRERVGVINSIIFSDYRRISKFADDCYGDIQKLQCGRMDSSGFPHGQGDTIYCLETHFNDLMDKCRLQVQRVAELQADDFHLDRALYFACAEDRELLCGHEFAGNYRIYDCLFDHKKDQRMSQECREHLRTRQQLISRDFKVSHSMRRDCGADVKELKCSQKGSDSHPEVRLSRVILCLENGHWLGHQLDGKCVTVMRSYRHYLLEDYTLSPELLHHCSAEIDNLCHKDGNIVHCLRRLYERRLRNKQHHIFSPRCAVMLKNLMKVADVDSDWAIDPVLHDSCKPVVDAVCSDEQPGEGRIMACLKRNRNNPHMTEQCRDVLSEIMYIEAREFNLDHQLYQACHTVAQQKCHAGDNWAPSNDDSPGPDPGPVVMACLIRLFRQPANQNDELHGECRDEVWRVMKTRAENVGLQPEIEEACMPDIQSKCIDKTGVGEEMACLQEHYETLSEDCQVQVKRFTEDEAQYPALNAILMRECKDSIKKYYEEQEGEEGDSEDMFDALLDNKKHLPRKCKAIVTHFQVLSLEEVSFSPAFQKSCIGDIHKLCDPKMKTMAQALVCLSGHVTAAVIDGHSHVVSKSCREEVQKHVAERAENVDLDPELKNMCSNEIKQLCDLPHGEGRVLECLREKRKDLSPPCHKLIFNREKEQMVDSNTDFLLNHACGRMIRTFCADKDGSEILDCLADERRRPEFDSTCKTAVTRRLLERTQDYRLNPSLNKACHQDIPKFCAEVVSSEPADHELEGLVTDCLKKQLRKRKNITPQCETELKRLSREQALDYRMDPVLLKDCAVEIKEKCSPDAVGGEGAGRVEECLKNLLVNDEIKSPECKKSVAELVEDVQVDIHIDPVLEQTCSLDLTKFCSSVASGYGRKFACLLEKSMASPESLTKHCRTSMKLRQRMLEVAVRVAPPESIVELVDDVFSSPSKSYFLLVGGSILFVMFIGGLFCGRLTKRARAKKMT